MKAKVEFEITPPTDCTEQQFKEWIDYSLGLRADILMTNPLCDYDLDLSNNNCKSVNIIVE